MKIVWGLTTYNRIDCLKKTVQSWEKTHNPKHQWVLVASDDGSEDGSQDYLKSNGFHVIQHKRRGVHHQTNAIIKYCSTVNFDVAFKTDDDVIFKQKTWDDKYIEAIIVTGYDHLNFHDLKWKRKKRHRNTTSHPSQLIENRAFANDTQGALWTLTPAVIEKVGYFDLQRFGACGFGHRDYTFRCCRAGFNIPQCIYDIKDSNKYLKLIKKNYKSASENYFKIWNYPEKISRLRNKRTYVPYNAINYDILGRSIYKVFG